ncbi:conserved hypothetical protein [Perkinsus marinus ATCC 50983]|uniref:Sugar phosphate transporter domain-containing protein n=1 Tax=Perkinsus marinus (strain ATCC 50983 / TXsc) TaxID=423536 RepID=C5KAM1_PERM5|nr:conserved hypothetical protein [Perkinsus marinus ATCC 50983]EER18197.1 conserved hypothetical protein [Perkinsus marinus ATCC 50983]|eukprot:XP_002786401.1 conserved hypothetical protein [Perkinsus marinus ATCC 50983]
MSTSSASPSTSDPRQQVLRVALAILGWYATSMSITALNKYLFSNLGVKFPLIVTFIHFSTTSIVLYLLFAILPAKFDRPVISAKDYIRAIIPIAICAAADIGFSNLSYSRISITAMTVVKSSAVVVTYLVGLLFGIEKFRWPIMACALTIMVAISSSVPGMRVDDWLGILFVALAVLSTAFRWVLVQTQCTQFSALQLMYLTQPVSALALLPLAIILDAPHLSMPIDTSGEEHIVLPICIICATAALAFLLLFTEYRLVEVTSSLTLCIAGIGKEVATILMSVVLFDDWLSLRQAIAVTVSIAGIITYSTLRIRYTNEEAQFDRLKEVPDDGDGGGGEGGGSSAIGENPFDSPTFGRAPIHSAAATTPRDHRVLRLASAESTMSYYEEKDLDEYDPGTTNNSSSGLAMAEEGRGTTVPAMGRE